MSKPNETWTVVPHGDLVALNDHLLTVTAEMKMPLGTFERRMTIAKVAKGELIVFSPICLSEPAMQQVEAFGQPRYLVVPMDRHRLDIKPWKLRYPQALVITPPGSVEKVQEVVAVEAQGVDGAGNGVIYRVVPGTGEKEAALVVEAQDGTTLVLNELIFNVPNKPGFGGFVMKAMGMTGDEPHIPAVIEMRDIDDKEAFAAQLRAWAKLPSLVRVIVSHGRIIDRDPAGVLTRIADELAS